MSTDPWDDFPPGGLHASSDLLPQKWGHVMVPLSRRERVQWWARGVWFELQSLWRSIVQMPPREISQPVVLNPGDPGYDNPFNLIIVKRTTHYQCSHTEAAVNPLTPGELEGLGSLKGGEKP